MSFAWLKRLRPTPSVSATLFVAAVCCILVGLEVRQRWDAYRTVEHEASIDTANLAASLAGQADSMLRSADIVLIGLRERFLTDGDSPPAIARLEHFMRLRHDTLPLLNNLFLFDSAGGTIALSDPGRPRDLNFADRPYMAWHRDHPEDFPHITPPYRSRFDNAWVVVVTRRVNHADGSFAGVIGTTIKTDMLQTQYDSFDLGRHGVIVLTSDTGEIFVRSPFDEGTMGRSIAGSPMFPGPFDPTEKASFAYVSPVDGKQRFGSFARVPGLGLIVFVAREKAEMLAGWQAESGAHAATLAIVLLTIGGLGFRMAAQIRIRNKADALYRLLTDNASDAIIWSSLDGYRRYVSPSFVAMTGWTEVDLLRKAFLDIIHPDDHPTLRQAMADLAAGHERVIATYRYIRPDGSTFWAELRAQTIPSAPGAPLEYVANIRDISRQKQAEDERDAAIAALAAMTLQDPLTKIANRRHFDQTLNDEWQRAMRDHTPVSLLMIDADKFKSFNDTYGHVAGDHCLQAIAELLQSVIRRPGDLASRYGGEEFAVILAGVAADGAALVAERMRMVLAKCAIPHTGNATGRVTLSIGIATLIPTRNDTPDTLLTLADAALYQAKQSGRDRIAVAAPLVLADHAA